MEDGRSDSPECDQDEVNETLLQEHDLETSALRSRSCWQRFVHGPKTPQKPRVSMWAKPVQTWPTKLNKKLPVFVRNGLLIFGLLLWLYGEILIARQSLFAQPTVNGSREVHPIKCARDSTFWKGPNAKCGLDGTNCYAVNAEVGTIYQFRCQANCRRESWTYTPMPVGEHVAYHESFIVGGDNVYRADSSICAAALHRGVISNSVGGCGAIRILGPQSAFQGQQGNNSMTSFPFDSEFVSSFEFLDPSLLNCKGCHDYRMALILWNLAAVVIFGYFVTNAALFLTIVTTVGFWTVIVASNPPLTGGDADHNAEIISLGFRRYLPCMLGVFAIYKVATRAQLKDMPANLSRMLFWALPFYVGILENYTLGFIPVDRLMISDLNSQPGAWFAVMLILTLVICAGVGQAWVIWKDGKLFQYLSGYLIGLATLLILSALPHLTLRVHHYILALALLPGTYPSNSISMVYQGLLVGLFVAGISRWDFDSILQTYDQLRRGGPEESGGVAMFQDPHMQPQGSGLADVVLRWNAVGQGVRYNASFYDGFALVINDVVRWRGIETSFNLTHWALDQFDSPQPLVYYVRIAVANVAGKYTGSFTRAGVVDLGEALWTPPIPGKV